MVLTKCKNGHFYNHKQNEKCPFCQTDNLKIELICIFGKRSGQTYYLKEGINHIGSGYQMDVVLDDENISEDNHCVIRINESEVSIIPAGGTVTYINGSLLQNKQIIFNEDIIRMGQSEYKLIIERNSILDENNGYLV